ncbi:MAG: hypothetical protein JWP22_2693 [Ramlibacter sp.]|jgi:hypothetical protein|nr:hypothetical protein [Ramlibacter sp.]MDB5914018.1 hypothetical protein [Ramlibacter sp.]
MNRTLSTFAFAAVAAAAIAASFVTPAYADDITPTPAFTSTRSRAEVQAELRQFIRDGVNPWADNYAPQQAVASSRTRDQVTAEFLASREEVAAMSGEDSGSAYLRLAQGQDHSARVFAGDLDNLQ